jgi:hypothetical protein
LLVALALTLVWSLAALFVMWRRRPGQLLARERAQLALLLFEAVAVAVFVAWATTT